MKTWLLGLRLFLVMVLLACSHLPVSAASVTITVANPPANDLLELEVGESYTFEIQVTSDERFVLAIALGDEYYPGRGIFFNGNDTAHQTSTAILHLTVTGKESTADLAPVGNGPPGVAPAGVVVGVRFAGGQVISQRYDFVVKVS
jgi:hypothetical protein